MVLRLRAGLSQRELGDVLGVHQSTISLWENLERIPSDEILTQLRETLHDTPEVAEEMALRRIKAADLLADWDDILTRKRRAIAR